MNEILAIQKLSFARNALSEAKNLQEIKQIKDIAVATKAYIIAKGLGIEMKNEASEVEIRAIREMGKLLKQKQEAGEVAKPQQPLKINVPEGYIKPKTLPEIGITRKESSTSKNLSSLPDNDFKNIIRL